MKSILFIISVLVSAAWVKAQDKSTPIQVPTEVVASLKKSYPEVTELKWSQKKEKYTADFKVGKTKHEVTMDKAGAVTKHQYEIKKEDLPKTVTDAITKEFSTYTVHDCRRTDNKGKGTTTFKVELKSTSGKKDVTFASDGKVIVKEED